MCYQTKMFVWPKYCFFFVFGSLNIFNCDLARSILLIGLIFSLSIMFGLLGAYDINFHWVDRLRSQCFEWVFLKKKFYCYFSPSLHPTSAEPISLPYFHPPPWFCPGVLYSSSCNPLSSLSPPHSPLAIVRLFLTSMFEWVFKVSSIYSQVKEWWSRGSPFFFSCQVQLIILLS